MSLACKEAGPAAVRYERHRPEHTPLYGVVEQYYPRFLKELEARGESLPAYVRREFEAYLECGRLEYGFLRVRCEGCHAEKLVAFSCKGRGFCPSCGAARMVESAALLVGEVFPQQPVRQWVLSLPFELRFLLAREPGVLSKVLGLIYRAIEGHLIKQAGLTRRSAQSGAGRV